MAHTVTVEKAATRPGFPVYVKMWKNLATIHQPRVGRPQVGGGPRSRIYGFSRYSRKRLIIKVAEANNDPKYFCTLTYGQMWPSLEDAKEDIRVWTQRVLRLTRRAGLRVCILWRMERQARGAPHFHLLIWSYGSSRESLVRLLPGPSCSIARSHLASLQSQAAHSRRLAPQSRLDWLLALSAMWYERNERFGRGSRALLRRAVDLRTVRSRRQVVSYVSKYCAKVDKHEWLDPTSGARLLTGRVWGLAGDRSAMDSNSLVGLAALRSVDIDNALCDGLESEGMEWSANALREGVLHVAAFIPAGAFSRLVDRWFHSFSTTSPPAAYPGWGIFPRLTGVPVRA